MPYDGFCPDHIENISTPVLRSFNAELSNKELNHR